MTTNLGLMIFVQFVLSFSSFPPNHKIEVVSFLIEDHIVTTNVLLGLDALEDAVSTPCHHFFCRSCITKYITQSLEQQQVIIRIDSDEEDTIETSCSVCRAPLVQHFSSFSLYLFSPSL
jgi:hypothetical protein